MTSSSSEPVKMAMTADGAAKFLRESAEGTAKHSQDWDNFESICRAVVSAALKHSPVKGGQDD